VPICQDVIYQNILSNKFRFLYQGDTVYRLTDSALPPNLGSNLENLINDRSGAGGIASSGSGGSTVAPVIYLHKF
jgi:hypothetical protein